MSRRSRRWRRSPRRPRCRRGGRRPCRPAKRSGRRSRPSPMRPGSIRQGQRVRPRISRYVQPYAGRVIVRRDAAHAAASHRGVGDGRRLAVPVGRIGQRRSVELRDHRSRRPPRIRRGRARSGIAVRAWPLMPLLVVTGTVAMWWRRHVVGPALAVTGAAVRARRRPGGAARSVDGPGADPHRADGHDRRRRRSCSPARSWRWSSSLPRAGRISRPGSGSRAGSPPVGGSRRS